jgi:hypothetical protein
MLYVLHANQNKNKAKPIAVEKNKTNKDMLVIFSIMAALRCS